jgi:hypothetical protein
MLKDSWKEITPMFNKIREKFSNAIQHDDSTKKENSERIIKSIIMLF